MIKSKSDLINKLKQDINSVTFITRHNRNKEGYQVGIPRKCCYLQGNAFKLQNPEGTQPWVYFNDIGVKDNVLKFKAFDIIIDLMEV